MRLACRVPLYSANLCRHPMEATRLPSLRQSFSIPALVICHPCGNHQSNLRQLSVILVLVIRPPCGNHQPNLRQLPVIPAAVI